MFRKEIINTYYVPARVCVRVPVYLGGNRNIYKNIYIYGYSFHL